MSIGTIKPSTFWYAVATFSGGIIGIGIFGIPFVFAKAGFGVGLLFLILITAVVTFTYLLFGEVILRTRQRHQIFGYVKTYLGPTAKWIAMLNFWIAVFGFTAAILVVNGNFLSQTLSFIGINASPAVSATIMLIIIAYLAYRGLRTVSRVDLWMIVFFFLIVSLIAIDGLGHIEAANYVLSTGTFWFLPFGVILFSLLGVQAVPLAREVLIGKEKKLRKVIIIGTLIPFILYLIFAAVVVGVSGELTSPQAISGLMYSLGERVVFVGSLFGFFASASIFLGVLTSFKESLWQDFKFHKRWGLLLLLLPPYIIFLVTNVTFINTIELVGGVTGSINIIFLILMFAKAKSKGSRVPEYSTKAPNWLLYSLMLIFSLGALYTILFY